ncbi:MAG: hypothetical protein ACYCSW_11145 [bacterium]
MANVSGYDGCLLFLITAANAAIRQKGVSSIDLTPFSSQFCKLK